MKSEFFETIKIVDGVVKNISYHQARYESVLKEFKRGEFLKLEELLDPPKNGVYRCKIIYNIDNEVNICYFRYQKRVINSLRLIHNDKIDYYFKRNDRGELNELFDKRGSCDDILIVKNNLLSDTSIANIALFDGSVWLTPATPLLMGTTRARYLEMGKIIKADIRVDELKNFSKIALLNAMVDFDIIEKKLEDVIC